MKEMDNFARAAYADVGLTALVEAVEQLPWPLPDTALDATENELARVILNAYATVSLNYPVLCFDGPTPLDGDDGDQVAEIMGDFLGDLRHLLDHHGLDVAAIQAASLAADVPQTVADLHIRARLAHACIWRYAQAIAVDFAALDDTAAARFAEELAEESGDDVQAERIATRPRRYPDPLDRYTLRFVRLVLRLRRWAATPRH